MFSPVCVSGWGGAGMAVALVEMMQVGSQGPCPAPAPCLVAAVMTMPVAATQFSCPSHEDSILSSLCSSLTEDQGLAPVSWLATVL